MGKYNNIVVQIHLFGKQKVITRVILSERLGAWGSHDSWDCHVGCYSNLLAM